MVRRARRGVGRGVAAWLWVLALAAGCGGEEPEGGLERERFVEVVTELRRAETELPESDSAAAQFEARKEEILSRHGVTEEELRAYLRRHREDLDLIQETWDTLSERLREAPPTDSSPDRE